MIRKSKWYNSAKENTPCDLDKCEVPSLENGIVIGQGTIDRWIGNIFKYFHVQTEKKRNRRIVHCTETRYQIV